MPYLLYRLKDPTTGDELKEKDYFEPTNDPTVTIIQKVLIPLNQSRSKLGESPLVVAGVEVLADSIHLHSWKRTHIQRFANQALYSCARCGAKGYRYCTVLGEEKGGIIRTKPYDKEKNSLCRDPLKELPKKLTFKFKL
jgi:hypothetical protein